MRFLSSFYFHLFRELRIGICGAGLVKSFVGSTLRILDLLRERDYLSLISVQTELVCGTLFAPKKLT